MRLNKTLEQHLAGWTGQIIYTGILLAYFSTAFTRIIILENILGVLIVIGWLWLLAASVFHIRRNKWPELFVTLLLGTVGTLFVLLFHFVMASAITMIDGDHWADDLTIPDSLEYHEPKGSYSITRPDTIVLMERPDPDFELYNGFQPGLYHYDYWTSNIEFGTIYLKAFEVTREYPLSTGSLAESSEVDVFNPSDSIICYSTAHHFSIYEGDWGDYYAARFEVWLRPEVGGPEQKLFEKTYKIEGWMH